MNRSAINYATSYKKSHVIELKNIHLILNECYYYHLYSDNRHDFFTKANLNRWKRIESNWIKNEEEKCLKTYDCYCPVKDKTIVIDALAKHPVCNHPLFDYLRDQANLENFKTFFLNESILNLEFFDYLILSVIGCSDEAKTEIVNNLWSEAGRGNIQGFHTYLFKKLMDQLDLHYDRKSIIKKMSWEAVAGINLFSYFALYPFNKIKYFGLLAATEMLEPVHHNKLKKGMERVFQTNHLDHSYYTEQKRMGVAHADGWFERIILPKLLNQPYKKTEFWLGFYMRLNSAKNYYDELLKRYLRS